MLHEIRRPDAPTVLLNQFVDALVEQEEDQLVLWALIHVRCNIVYTLAFLFADSRYGSIP